jgi:hypothetical protein
MTAIPSVGGTGTEARVDPRTDHTTLAVRKALKTSKQEAEAMVRLIEGAGHSSKGQLIDYRA